MTKAVKTASLRAEAWAEKMQALEDAKDAMERAMKANYEQEKTYIRPTERLAMATLAGQMSGIQHMIKRVIKDAQ